MIIEISGQKFEVDETTARKVETFKVGQRVKLLRKSYSGFDIHLGAIVSIDAFQNLPTIVVAYLPENILSSTNGEIKFAYLNSQAKDMEILPVNEDEVMPNKETISMFFDKSIAKLQKEIDDLQFRKEWFFKQWGVSFAIGAEEIAESMRVANIDR